MESRQRWSTSLDEISEQYMGLQTARHLSSVTVDSSEAHRAEEVQAWLTITQTRGLDQNIQDIIEWKWLHLHIRVHRRHERCALLNVHPWLGLRKEGGIWAKVHQVWVARSRQVSGDDRRVGLCLKVALQVCLEGGQIRKTVNCSRVASPVKFLDFGLHCWAASTLKQV